jgi:hypothetical protein
MTDEIQFHVVKSRGPGHGHTPNVKLDVGAMASLTAKVEHEDSKPLPEVQYQDYFRFENVLSGTLRLFRPLAPHLVPVFVCLALIPVIIFLSLFSGWYVWKNVAVRWESPLYLQYG